MKAAVNELVHITNSGASVSAIIFHVTYTCGKYGISPFGGFFGEFFSIFPPCLDTIKTLTDIRVFEICS